MTFADLPSGASLLVDANTLVYHFSAQPSFGPACRDLLLRTRRREIQGFTSTHVLADVAHRLMTLEAMSAHGWPAAGLAARLRRHHTEIPRLNIYMDAIAKIPSLGIEVLPVTASHVQAATELSRKHELLTGDALIVAVMQHQGLRVIASNDADFDRVPGLMRYAPA